MITKPYYRIFRPGCDSKIVLDKRYADDRISLCRALKLIVTDLETMFEYIEPCDDNLNTYSHRIFELFLRTCTEFEANCKGILIDNGYSQSKRLDITDFYKINKPSRLSEYKVKLDIWRPHSIIFEPFSAWENGHVLKWYQAYNDVKHNRSTNFKDASLRNLMEAITGLLCILFSQFSIETLFVYNQCMVYSEDDDGYSFIEDFMFSIKEPDNWLENEKYSFDWKQLCKDEKPFEKYDFKS